LNAYLLIITTHAPYHTSAAADALEAALAASNVGIDTRVLFQSDGVYQLLNLQQAEAIKHKNIFKKLSALPLFDVEHIYVDSSSLDARKLKLSQGAIPWLALNEDEVMSLIKNAKNILVF
jgi:tRNA 2-thiouridine synthesizing protein C